MDHLRKSRKEYKSLKKQGIQDIFIKTNFQRDIGDGDFKDLTSRTVSDKILRDKTFDIAKNSKYDEYQRGLGSIVSKFFDKKTSVSGIKNENISYKELAE